MSFKDKYNINPEFSSLFEFKSEKDELKHDAKILMFRFLSEIEKLNENIALQKKDFAEAINVSRPFISQLFKGDKLANLITLAKLQKAFNVTFEVKAVPQNIIINNLENTTVVKNEYLFNINKGWLEIESLKKVA